MVTGKSLKPLTYVVKIGTPRLKVALDRHIKLIFNIFELKSIAIKLICGLKA